MRRRVAAFPRNLGGVLVRTLIDCAAATAVKHAPQEQCGRFATDEHRVCPHIVPTEHHALFGMCARAIHGEFGCGRGAEAVLLVVRAPRGEADDAPLRW
eukprot:5158580-Prymnesium_polylepis.1